MVFLSSGCSSPQGWTENVLQSCPGGWGVMGFFLNEKEKKKLDSFDWTEWRLELDKKKIVLDQIFCYELS